MGLEMARMNQAPATGYQWLEPKPHKRFTKQLGIKGRNMIVWNLIHPIVLGRQGVEWVAQDMDLPVEAVQEALDYYHANQDWIDEEVAQAGRRLRQLGLLKD
jgi:uncharacterized protein (DUF433 family)